MSRDGSLHAALPPPLTLPHPLCPIPLRPALPIPLPWLQDLFPLIKNRVTAELAMCHPFICKIDELRSRTGIYGVNF